MVTRPGRLEDFNSMVYEVAKSEQDSENALQEFAGAGCSLEKEKAKTSKKLVYILIEYICQSF